MFPLCSSVTLHFKHFFLRIIILPLPILSLSITRSLSLTHPVSVHLSRLQDVQGNLWNISIHTHLVDVAGSAKQPQPSLEYHCVATRTPYQQHSNGCCHNESFTIPYSTSSTARQQQNTAAAHVPVPRDCLWDKMRLSMLPPSLLLHVLLWAAARPARCSASDADFSAYPATTISCLSRAADQSGCDGDTVTETNSCLCSNDGNFVTLAAQCIGDQGEQALVQVYDTMQDSCTETKTPLSVSEADFLAAANMAVSITTVTSTVTTTSEGVATTFTTTSTSTSPVTATANSISSGDDDDDDDDDSDGQITVSAKAGAISASVAGCLMIACMVCLVVLLKKRKKDKALLQQVRDEARGHGGGGKGKGGGDKPLLDPGSTTPGLPPSPPVTFGASVTPPTPSYPGPTSPQVWRSASQTHGHAALPNRGGPTYSPSELSSEQWAYELYDSRNGQEPSPVSQGIGTMGSWCPSPLSAMASSTALGHHGAGTGTGTMGSTYSSGTGTMEIGTLGAISTLSHSSTRHITGTTRSSWAHNRPVQDEPYELPGTEVRSINPLPVEADSNPITMVPERLSMSISQAPPQYEQGDWIDPNTDKPPIGMI